MKKKGRGDRRIVQSDRGGEVLPARQELGAGGRADGVVRRVSVEGGAVELVPLNVPARLCGGRGLIHQRRTKLGTRLRLGLGGDVLTQELHDVLQKWCRVVVLDDHREGPDMYDVELPSVFFGNVVKDVHDAQADILRQIFLGGEETVRDIKSLKLPGWRTFVGEVDKPASTGPVSQRLVMILFSHNNDLHIHLSQVDC